jgi:F-type H+-transporting ATPase subunit a
MKGVGTMYLVFDFGDFALSASAVNALLVTIFWIVFFIISGHVIKKADPASVSKGFMGILEFIYSTVDKFVAGSVGEKSYKFVPFIITVGSYLVLANLLGLVGLRPPTTNVNITVALTVVTIVYIMVVGIQSLGVSGYLKAVYVGGAKTAPPGIKQFIILINIIGELVKIVSMSMRLFGNIVSGTLLVSLLVGLIVGIMNWFVPIGVIPIPIVSVLNAFFDVFAGLMQTFIFATLIMMWTKTATEREV